jgi:hypothetical protein
MTYGDPSDPPSCLGRLVVHLGGSVAFCTEEHEEWSYAGYGVEHASRELCWVKVAGQDCAVCDAAPAAGREIKGE